MCCIEDFNRFFTQSVSSSHHEAVTSFVWLLWCLCLRQIFPRHLFQLSTLQYLMTKQIIHYCTSTLNLLIDFGYELHFEGFFFQFLFILLEHPNCRICFRHPVTLPHSCREPSVCSSWLQDLILQTYCISYSKS